MDESSLSETGREAPPPKRRIKRPKRLSMLIANLIVIRINCDLKIIFHRRQKYLKSEMTEAIELQWRWRRMDYHPDDDEDDDDDGLVHLVYPVLNDGVADGAATNVIKHLSQAAATNITVLIFISSLSSSFCHPHLFLSSTVIISNNHSKSSAMNYICIGLAVITAFLINGES